MDYRLRGNDAAPEERRELSVEEGIAKTLNIHLGDELTYDVGATPFTARVTSLRKVEWDSMKVNFFVIATPELLQDFPASYLASFYLPPDKVRASDELAREFPNLLLIDTEAVIVQVRGIMDQIAQTVSAVFLFTLFSGLAVLYAALLSTQAERTPPGHGDALTSPPDDHARTAARLPGPDDDGGGNDANHAPRPRYATSRRRKIAIASSSRQAA
jgi:predicted lysophospholipase L1 biosynthesis ABC-type transport system permease subunit